PPAYSVRGSPVGCSPFLPLRRAGLSWCQRTARCRGRLRKTVEQRVLRARGFGTSSVSVVIELARFCGARITCGPANAKPLATKRSEENYDKEGDGCRASPAPFTPVSSHAIARCAHAFFTHAEPQPLAFTCLPGKIVQPPHSSFGLPWYCWQFAQV